MEKLSLETFRALRQEVIDYINKFTEAQNRDEELSEAEAEQFIERYKEIIKTLSEHDLSDIDFDEWQGMYLAAEEEIPLDFSKTKANLDFSVITYEGSYSGYFPNFQGCSIKNFNFDEHRYNDEMFDEEYRRENEGHFLSEEIPDEIKGKFSEGKLTLTDIKTYPELERKIGVQNLYYYLQDMYKQLGREEFLKLDETFIDAVGHSLGETVRQSSEVKTAEELMDVLYKVAREKILSYRGDDYSFDRFYATANVLGEKFQQLNPDLVLSEDAPDDVKWRYYNHNLSINELMEGLPYLEGKKVSHAMSTWAGTKKLNQLYGDGVVDLLKTHGSVVAKVFEDYNYAEQILIPNGPITEEQRNEIMSNAILGWVQRTGRFDSIDDVKMMMDFVPLEDLPMTEQPKKLIEKYGVDKLVEIGADLDVLAGNRTIGDIDALKRLQSTIDSEDMLSFVARDDRWMLEHYGIDQFEEYDIHSFEDVRQVVKDLQVVKELLQKRPPELINMGRYGDTCKSFIQKYGIDNIIAMDEETGLFSHELWRDEKYLTTMATIDGYMRRSDDTTKEYTYEEFRDKMYQLLLQGRMGERGVLQSGDYPPYDFIQGKFREEHPDIFIDDSASDEIKKQFYSGKITAESLRKHPELAELLKGKNLEAAFAHKQITARIGLRSANGFNIPNHVNMAQYLSEQLGEDEFLKLCSDYGMCLDKINFGTPSELTPENLRATIDKAIYKAVKETGLEYFEGLPETFKSEHPDLFLPEEISPEIREKFYAGKLSFEDIKKNPEIKDVILSKDVSVGFGKTKFGQTMLARPGQRYVNPLWENLSEQEILDFAEEYGRYLSYVNQESILEGKTFEERDGIIRSSVEENIFNRISYYRSDVPEFFKEKYPDMFLDENAPADLKKVFYDGQRLWNFHTRDTISFQAIKEHPEWKEFIQGKDLSRAFPKQYEELFKRFDDATLLKMGTRNPQMMELMVSNHRESTLENWYKATGGKFVPHHIVMLNFPENEIDSFLGNSKKWSQLMKIDRYNLNDEGKSAILKAAYSMGVFQGNDDGFNKTMELFTQIPRELSQEEYDNLIKYVSENPFDEINDSKTQSEGTFEPNLAPIQEAYTQNENGTYVLRMNQQQEKGKAKELRGLLERSGYPKILTPEKAHQLFDSFAMEYSPEFYRFFNNNIEQVLANPELIKDMPAIQRQFKDIVRTNAGRRLTFEVAQDYIRSIAYENIEIGNEGVAEQAKIAGYSQADFDAIQKLYNEGETRDFSSIPRIEGRMDGYTYEMLRCDDPLALTVGTLTDCCQEIHGAGQTSMEHSVVSPDGRVFCVRDDQGRLVAQSWFWRNQYTGCFDNIEIPHRIFELFEKEHLEQGRKGLTQDVLEVYKKAAQELMQEDEKVYSELLENGTITQEQYDSLLLGKVTIGLGYNDIADAIRTDKTIHQDRDTMQVKKTDRLPHPYTDASTQYTIAERDNIVKATQTQENLYVHQDMIPEFDASNMSTTTLLTMKRMEQSVNGNNLAYLDYENEEVSLNQSQKIMNSISREYGLNPEDTKVLATARIAMIYSKAEDKIKIGDIFSSPIKQDLTIEQQQRAEEHIKHQMKKALNQIGVHGSEVDLSLLNENQRKLLQDIIQQIEKDNDERGER